MRESGGQHPGFLIDPTFEEERNRLMRVPDSSCFPKSAVTASPEEEAVKCWRVRSRKPWPLRPLGKNNLPYHESFSTGDVNHALGKWLVLKQWVECKSVQPTESERKPLVKHTWLLSPQPLGLWMWSGWLTKEVEEEWEKVKRGSILGQIPPTHSFTTVPFLGPVA